MPIIEDSRLAHQNTPIVGIDFGTTQTLVAMGNPPMILSDHNGPLAMRTLVAYEGTTTHYGVNMHQPIASVKRLMGQKYVNVQNLPMHYVVEGDKGAAWVRVNNRHYTPEKIASDFLSHLRGRVSSALQKECRKAVVTVPAYFSEKARHAVRQSALNAGWEPLRLLAEPTAAAIAYELEKRPDGTYLVYDWGGGTFDVSLLTCTKGVFHILALGGDTLLGGDDIDAAFAKVILQGASPSPGHIASARQAKEQLTQRSQAWWSGERQQWVTREDLEKAMAPLLAQTLKVCDAVMLDAQMTYADIDQIIIVGGTTRIPAIRKALVQHMNAPILDDINPQEVVAYGAARYAAQLQKGTAFVLVDALPLSLGIEVMGGIMEVIIPRNTSIPCSVTHTFTTSVDAQKYVLLNVLQGERDIAAHCVLLRTLKIGPLPSMPASVPKIAVTFLVDADGILSVSVVEEVSQNKCSAFISDVVRAPEREQVIKDAVQYAHDDARESMRRNLKYTLQTIQEKIDLLRAQGPIHARVEAALQAACLAEETASLEDCVRHLEQTIVDCYGPKQNK